ncbi:MAG: hypothetical protein ACFFAN_06750 [Promethearchaeota archaeon]
MTRLSIEGYEGDYPTFIEPMFLSPGVKIGDTVLLGPNLIIGENCEIGPFCDLSNVIIQKVVMGRQWKLNYCIVDENIDFPEKFQAKECLIIKNEKGDLEKINF